MPSLDALRDAFEPATLERGTAYARSGHVLRAVVQTQDDGHVVVGHVRGSGTTPYRVTVGVWSTPHGWRADGDCTCPVGYDCKHAAALLVAVTDGVITPKASWEHELGAALSNLEALRAPAAASTPLALVVDHATPTSSWGQSSDHAFTLRPVRLGTKGRWVKTGASWNDLRQHRAYGNGDLDPAQVEVLAAMGTAFHPGYAHHLPHVLHLNALLWPLLQQCADVGIALVPGASLTSVTVLEPQSVVADVTATPGAVTLRTGLVTPEAWWPSEGHEVLFIGTPAHGVALLREVPPPERARGPHWSLALAPLDKPVDAATQRLLAQPLHVPTAQREQFESRYLPRLRRQLEVHSRDASVALPEVPRPRLELTLAWGPGHRAETSWAWRYGSDRFGLRSLDGLVGVRDVLAEEQVVDDLPLELRTLRDVGGDLLDHRTWLGRDLVELSAHLVPELRALAQVGDIELVETGEQRDYRPADDDPEISFHVPDESERGPNDWLDLSVSIVVDGESVPLGLVLEALTRRHELVFTETGRHVRTDHPAFAQLAELVAAAKELVDQPDDKVRVARHDLALWNELEAIGVVDAQAEQWMRSARALRDFDGLPAVRPTGVVSELRGYQQTGAAWLAFLWEARLGGILADDMGLGKTLQALTLVAHARERGAAPFLVVAPTSVVTAWVEQARTHAPDLVVRVVGSSAARRGRTLAQLHDGADVVLTTYTLFRLESDVYAGLEWGGLLLDEAQNVKNHQGKTYHAVRRLDVPFRLALTGTPFENRLMELWSLLSVVAPGLYASPARFKQLVARPVEQLGDAQTLARFQRRIRPFLLRRTKEQVADDLPPKQEHVVPVELTPRHRTIYDTHLQRERQTVLGLIDDGFDRNRVAIFSALTRLRQLSLDPGLVDDQHDGVGSAKLDLLVDHLREITAEGHQSLVFSQFTSYLGRVRDRLEAAGLSVAYLDGRTRRRDVPIDMFRSGEASVFLISLKAGGVGLTLTEADYVFVLDPWWNPATEAQAVDRAHRIGQDKHVMVYRLVSTGTIEEKVMALKDRKAELFARVLDGDVAMSSELTASDVQALFEA